MTSNYVRDALETMTPAERRGVSNSAVARANADPRNAQVLTRLLFALHCEIVDFENELADLEEQVADDEVTVSNPADPALIAELEAMLQDELDEQN